MSYGDGRDTYAQTEWSVPGDKPGAVITLHAGDVVRMNDWSSFPDSVILGFNKYGDAKVSRPYAYVSGAGTTGPTVLLGAETYTLPVDHILKHYTIKENDGHRAK